jgi:hypothetical protein
MNPQQLDNDIHKGAVEDDNIQKPEGQVDADASNVSMAGQLGHRAGNAQDDEITDGNDTDFPEPGQRPEHSGQSK